MLHFQKLKGNMMEVMETGWSVGLRSRLGLGQYTISQCLWHLRVERIRRSEAVGSEAEGECG